MRISSLDLSWFRGAASSAALKTEQKSMVIYGCNGAGKSTFVDGVEYILRGGKIDHLAHEYSGLKQEKGILNTHKPSASKAMVKLTFSNGASVEYQIADSGVFQRDDKNAVNPETWDIDKILLRHANLSEFITAPKSEKYNTLLPLLGLHNLEVYAQNIRDLKRTVESESKVPVKESEADALVATWRGKFGKKKADQIIGDLIGAINTYIDKPVVKTEDKIELYASQLKSIVEEKLANSNKSVRVHGIFMRANTTAAHTKMDALKNIDVSALENLGQFIEDRLAILEASGTYAAKISTADKIDCPSCGTSVQSKDYKEHILKEQNTLKSALETLRQRNAAQVALSSSLENLINELRDEDLDDWIQHADQSDVKGIVEHLETWDLEALKKGFDEQSRKYLDKNLPGIYANLAAQVKNSPPEVVKLNADLETAKTALTYDEIQSKLKDIKQLKKVPQFLEKLEGVVRLEIKKKTQEKIDLISADIQKYWGILHPGKPMKNIKLYLPDESIKGIDIALEFYGVAQDSPRLTLSEGYRNSLALCIFLALSKQEEKSQKPIILDDVVISFDREHRRQVTYLIQKEFSNRQILIFTHDREWFAELRAFLDVTEWRFKTLGYWQSPTHGVVWADKEGGISDATIFLQNGEPEKAVQHARAYLDVYLSIVADKLQIKMPYVRGENNDRRTGVVFLGSLINESKGSLKCQTAPGKYEAYVAAALKWDETAKLLIIDANRGTHGGVVSNTEAASLIESCEETLSHFMCDSCKQNIWKLEDQGGKFCQCKCGKYKWSY
jgi:RecF/RecN/SMC N terminal domain